MSKIIEIDEKKFEEEVLKAKGIVVVDFWASWCGPCKMLAPILEEISEELDGKIKFTKINVDQNSDLASRNNIMSIPTLVVFKDGKIVDQILGLQEKKSLITKLKSIK